MNNRIYVGASGWHYQHWLGPFYPPGLKSAEMLAFYCQRLRTVEINNSFYHLPSCKTYRSWKDNTPHDFAFSVKASRYITHMKKLRDPEPSLKEFLLHAGELGSKLGPILFQLPPHWKRNAVRLKDFLDALPRAHRYTFEFRDPTWFHNETYSLLRQHNAAFCVFDLAGDQSPFLTTADFVYVRLHGPAGQKYSGRYTRGQLRSWLQHVEDSLAGGAREAFVYFDNDQAGYAALNALEFQEMAEASGQ